MLLQRLVEYAQRPDFGLPPTLYGEAPVRYIVELDGAGRPLNRRPTDTADPASHRTRRGLRRLVPHVQRAVGVRPLLLADNAEYTLGLPRAGSRPARVAACHDAYLRLLDRCAADGDEPAIAAVRAFLRDDPAARLDLPEDYDRGAAITFRVGEVFPVDLPSVQAFWAAENDPASGEGRAAPVMQCLVCGRERPVLGRLQGKIKGVPGGQPSGVALLSANADAFESYGLAASLVAPTCAACGERFTQALNRLLADEASRIVLAGVAFIFWTRERVDFSLHDVLAAPKPEQVRGLIVSVHTGRPMPGVDEAAFYATALSGSGGRAVVREWIDTTVGEVRHHLAVWFERQRIVDPYGGEPRPLGLYALASAIVRDPRDLAPPTSRALLRAALTDTSLPASLLHRAVSRNRAERAVTRQRAALIKLVLLGGEPARTEGTMVQLDPDNTDPAYRCGRLLAVLEEAQRAAIPGLTATIVDRFYGTASTAPASVFGRLVRGAQPHLGKLARDRPAAYRALQRRLEDIQAGIAAFPRTLTLEGQGLFALGYYHQRAHDRREVCDAARRHKAGLAHPADGGPAGDDGAGMEGSEDIEER